jgi:hypothetical protein
MDDVSGNGNDMAQENAAKRLTTNVDTINGKNALTCAGGYHLERNNPTGRDPNDFMVIGLWDLTTGFAMYSQSGSPEPIIMQRNAINPRNSPAGNYVGGDLTGLNIVAYDIDFTTGYVDAYINGEFNVRTSLLYQVGTNGLMRLNANFVAGSGITGKFGELWISNDKSVATIQKYEGFIAHKWGVTSLLPVGHPYKSSAPEV